MGVEPTLTLFHRQVLYHLSYGHGAQSSKITIACTRRNLLAAFLAFAFVLALAFIFVFVFLVGGLTNKPANALINLIILHVFKYIPYPVEAHTQME